LLSGDLSEDVLLAEALELLRAHPAVQQARARLAGCVAEARTIADALPASPVRAALLALADFVLARTG